MWRKTRVVLVTPKLRVLVLLALVAVAAHGIAFRVPRPIVNVSPCPARPPG